MKYEITKEQILELDKGLLINTKLRKWFPDAFKKELEVGKWYFVDGNNCGQNGRFLIANFSGEEEASNYGFDFNGKWSTELYLSKLGLGLKIREATPEEVETALIAEAKKRGFVNGANYIYKGINIVRSVSGDIFIYNLIDNSFRINGFNIFNNGNWAVILPEEPKVEEKTFKQELKSLLNKYSKENGSDIRDFILAIYLTKSLKIFNEATNGRMTWNNNYK